MANNWNHNDSYLARAICVLPSPWGNNETEEWFYTISGLLEQLQTIANVGIESDRQLGPTATILTFLSECANELDSWNAIEDCYYVNVKTKSEFQTAVWRVFDFMRKTKHRHGDSIQCFAEALLFAIEPKDDSTILWSVDLDMVADLEWQLEDAGIEIDSEDYPDDLNAYAEAEGYTSVYTDGGNQFYVKRNV